MNKYLADLLIIFIMDLYEGERYYTTLDGLKDTLSQYGVAVIPNLLNDFECSAMKDGMWDYLEAVSKNFEVPINRQISSSWGGLSELWVKHSMLIQHWSIGHAQFIWDLRQNQKVIDVFSKIWGVSGEDLLVSFDGASFHMPPEKTKKGWFKGKTWYHSDQSYLRNDLECIQSWVTAYDVNRGDATLTFYEGSHKYHADFRKKFGWEDKSDWCLLSEEDHHDFYLKEHGCEKHHITCPAGSLVLWDSRTIHCGQEAMKEREESNFRCVAYLCYTPRAWTKESVLKRKRKAFDEMRTTNHWPHKPKMFPKTPRTFGKAIAPIESIDPPIVNDLGRRMAGF